MISHLSFGVSDLKKSVEFYDNVLKTLGYKRLYTGESFAAYGESYPVFWLNLPLDRSSPASAGNGTHVSFIASSQAAVDTFYQTALDNGAADAGTPGLRPEYAEGYYAAYVFDLDGHKIEADHYTPVKEEDGEAEVLPA